MKRDKRGGRPLDELRPVKIEIGFQKFAEGSVLFSAGDTRVLVTASIDESVPEFLKGKGRGWLSAEYQMHPRANPDRRQNRDGRERPLGGRAREIQRLVGRALRAAVHLDRLGERSVLIDCDVIEADGGTRTAAVTAGFIAVATALSGLGREKTRDAPLLRDVVAAVSVGHVDDSMALDLCYAEDSSARVDLNLVATEQGRVVEIQGTAEGEAVERHEIDRMLDLGLGGIKQLSLLQRAALGEAGVDLERLMR
jgi:ribonuclease PH